MQSYKKHADEDTSSNQISDFHSFTYSLFPKATFYIFINKFLFMKEHIQLCMLIFTIMVWKCVSFFKIY